jgi:hypothetical protein
MMRISVRTFRRKVDCTREELTRELYLFDALGCQIKEYEVHEDMRTDKLFLQVKEPLFMKDFSQEVVTPWT